MQLQFLGTSASEGYPNAFCACDNCETARRLGGPSLRKRSAALIDGELLIDLGPDLMAAALQHGVSLAGIRYCLQTHEHHDHFDPSHFGSRSAWCGVYGTPRLHYYASHGAIDKALALSGFSERTMRDPDADAKFNLTPIVIAPFQEFTAGPYRILSLKARHAPELTAMLYLIERAGRVLLYATDTGDLPDETWQALREHGPAINVVAMDHTFGMRGRSGGHMNAEQFLEQIARLREWGLLAADARIYAHHLAHHSNPSHPELEAWAAQYGYAPAYDGLTVAV